MEMANNNGGLKGVPRSKERKETAARTIAFVAPELVLRALALLTTLTAAIMLGLNKETKMIPVKPSPILPAINVPVIAKTSYVSAFVYSVVANSIAAAFATISLALAFASERSGKSGLRLMIIVADLMMVALLFSSIGAADAIGLISYKGNSHLRWNKVCDVYGKFCHQSLASLILSLVGGTAFMLLVILSASKLQKRT